MPRASRALFVSEAFRSDDDRPGSPPDVLTHGWIGYLVDSESPPGSAVFGLVLALVAVRLGGPRIHAEQCDHIIAGDAGSETRAARSRRALGRWGDGAIREPRRIAFINEKGGSGKTTLVANVAAHLALNRGRRVLVVDMDPQGQLGKVLGLEVRQQRRSAIELLVDGALGTAPSPSGGDADRLPALPTRIPGLQAIVANKSLALFPTWTGAGESDPTLRLASALDGAAEVAGYDYVLFDAPPSFGPLTLNVLRASREVVIPVPLTFLALDGSAELMRTIELVRTRYANEALRVSLVIPTFYRRTKLAHEILERLAKRFPSELSAAVVGYHVKIDEAQSRGRSIFEYAPRSRGARLMAELADELEERGTLSERRDADEPARGAKVRHLHPPSGGARP